MVARWESVNHSSCLSGWASYERFVRGPYVTELHYIIASKCFGARWIFFQTKLKVFLRPCFVIRVFVILVSSMSITDVAYSKMKDKTWNKTRIWLPQELIFFSAQLCNVTSIKLQGTRTIKQLVLSWRVFATILLLGWWVRACLLFYTANVVPQNASARLSFWVKHEELVVILKRLFTTEKKSFCSRHVWYILSKYKVSCNLISIRCFKSFFLNCFFCKQH